MCCASQGADGTFRMPEVSACMHTLCHTGPIGLFCVLPFLPATLDWGGVFLPLPAYS